VKRQVALQTKNQFNKMKPIYSLTLLSLIFLFSCKKDDPKPEEKQTNTNNSRELMYYSPSDSSIYTIDENGNNQSRLCYVKQISEIDFDYSRSTNKILYISNQGVISNRPQIYTSNPDGSNLSKLSNKSNQIQSVAFSNDGMKISYFYYNDSVTSGDIKIMNSDGSNEKTISFPSTILGYFAGYLNWSPNDSLILFRADVIYQDSSRKDGLFTIKTDGSSFTQILDSTLNPHYPKFSPDGSKIIFIGYNETAPDINGNIYSIDANGGNLTKLTSFNRAPSGHSTNIRNLNWSADGSKIAFTSNKDTPKLSSYLGKYYEEVYVMDKDGANITQLTNDTLYQSSPVWR